LVHIGTRRLSDFPPAQRSRILQMLTDMGAYMSVVINAFFCYALHEVVQAATQPIPHLELRWALALMAGGILGVTLYYLVKLLGAARSADGESPRGFTP
jgi:hypothetical protein